MQAHFPNECGCKTKSLNIGYLHIHVGAASMSVDNDFTFVRRLTDLAGITYVVCAYAFVFWICVDIQFL